VGCRSHLERSALPTPSPDRTLLFPLLLSSPLYTLRDIYNLLVGFQFCTAELFEEIMAYDARKLGSGFEVPLFVFQGESDVIRLTSLAEEYFAEVEAPTKALALIKNAGHFAAFSQPEQFLSELLRWVRPLASVPSP
jgi:pimeloyl-ACP methyl ester carboxylesterase